MRTLLRILGVAVALVAILGGLGYIKFAQISSLIGMAEAMEESGPPPEAVSSTDAVAQTWEESFTAVGTVATSKGVTVSTEVAGVVTTIAFESGKQVEKGDMLVQLDARVAKAQLAQAQVRRQLALATVQRARALVGSGAESQAQVDADESGYAAANAEIDLLRAQIARKTIRAPFAGRLGIREINVGQYLNPGTTVTTLEGTKGVYVDFEVPQQREVALGTSVRLVIEGLQDYEGEGEVVAIEPNVDPRTRNKKIRASITRGVEPLQPGMFVKVAVIRPETHEVVAVPQTAIMFATYGDSVFIVEPPAPDTPAARATGPNGEPVMIARQQFVKLGQRRGDFVAVTEGLQAGQEVVSAGGFKLRNGAPIYLDDSREPTPSLNPSPENR